MVTIWPRWQSLLVYLTIFLSQLSNFISSQSSLLNQLQESQGQTHELCCMNWKRHACSSHPPIHLEGPRSCSNHLHSLCRQLEQPHLRISLRTMHGVRERNKNRAILQPEGTLCGLLSFGSNWHRPLPQEAAKVPCVEFFFHFHCVVRVKVVAFGSYIPSALLLFPGSRDLFSIRWNTKALSPFGRTRS